MQVTCDRSHQWKKGDNDSYECIYDLVTVDGLLKLIKINFSVTKIYLRLIFLFWRLLENSKSIPNSWIKIIFWHGKWG
jgi:hypothetical protein